MWYVCDVLYAVLYVHVSCFVVRGCAVSRRYIHVFNCDMFGVVNVYIDYLKFCVVCIDGLGFMNCDDICMCVVNKQFELLELVFDSVYVDLQYDELSLSFTAGSVSLCCVCGRLWSVCEVVVVPYVDVVIAVTVMRVLLFVLHVCLLRECDGARLTAMLV